MAQSRPRCRSNWDMGLEPVKCTTWFTIPRTYPCSYHQVETQSITASCPEAFLCSFSAVSTVSQDNHSSDCLLQRLVLSSFELGRSGVIQSVFCCVRCFHSVSARRLPEVQQVAVANPLSLLHSVPSQGWARVCSADICFLSRVSYHERQ